MPQDNTGAFYREKLAELDETLPPEVTWHPAQGWQQLQPKLSAKHSSIAVWYRVAAAVAILIASGLFLLNNHANQTAVPRQIVVAKQTFKPQVHSPLVSKPTETTLVNPPVAVVLNKLQARKNFKKQLKKEPNLANKAIEQKNKLNSDLASVIENTSAPNSETSLATTVDPPPVEQASVKITVVLGGKTTRQSAVYATENNQTTKRKNNRLKVQVNLPGEMPLDDTNLPATANHLPDRSALSARIEL